LKRQKEVIVLRGKGLAHRISVTAAAYSRTGAWLAGAAHDGSLRFWNASGPYFRPTIEILEAHQSGCGISSIRFGPDDILVASRGNDHTLKGRIYSMKNERIIYLGVSHLVWFPSIVWDLRKYRKPLATCTDLFNDFEETGCDFSPQGDFVITGTSAQKDSRPGSLMVMNTNTLECLQTHELGMSLSVLRTVWHTRLNQIILSCSDGSTRVLFDDDLSVKGAKLCADKIPRVSQDRLELASVQPEAFMPTGLVTERSLKRRAEKARLDPVKSRRPELPVVGHGRGGRVGSSLTAHLMKTLIKDTSREEDPREALIRHAQAAESNPFWVAPAYQQTQPRPVFSEEVDVEETDEPKNKATSAHLATPKPGQFTRTPHSGQTPSSSRKN
jgi:WD repeat-containing protein 70